MDLWKISGADGYSFGDTKRTFPDLHITNPQLTIVSLGVDTLSFQQTYQAPAEALKMDLAQPVSLWRNGVREFHGVITSRRTRDTTTGTVIDTVVEGPWYWLKNTPLSGEVVDELGNTVSRMQFPIDSEDLSSSLESVINRIIALGVPISMGHIDASFVIPTISLPSVSCANGIAELLRWLPDAVVWFDYSDTSKFPAINITRRKFADAYTLTAGAPPVASSDIAPRLDLKVSHIRLLYAKRDPVTQKFQFVELSSGTAGTATAGTTDTITLDPAASESDDAYTSLNITLDAGTGAGQTRTISAYDGNTKTATVQPAWDTAPDTTTDYTVGLGKEDSAAPTSQILTVSGPELTDFLPANYYESQTLRSTDIYGTGVYKTTPTSATCMAHDTFIAGLVVNYPNDESSMLTNIHVLHYNKVIVDKDGNAPPSDMRYRLSSGEFEDWFDYSNLNFNWMYVYIECDAYFIMSTESTGDPSDSFTGWMKEFSDNRDRYEVQYDSSTDSYTHYYFYRASLKIPAVNQKWTTDQTVYRKQDWEFIHPPAELAYNLAETQNWIPYTGSIVLRDQTMKAERLIDKQFNLLPEHATMGALPKQISYQLGVAATTIELGPPARDSYRNLVNKFRQQGRDNLVYL